MTFSSKIAVLATASFAALAASPATAHVGLEKPVTERGKSYKAVLKVPHGCEGSATHTVRVDIPEGFIGVKPMPKAGWTIKTQRGAYARSYGYYHGPLAEGVKQIEWSGGSLPDAYYDEFVAAGYVAKELEADALYFKVVQLCDKGELNWVDIPAKGVDAHDLAAPAAVLKIAGNDAPVADEHDHSKHQHDAADTAGSAKAGSIAIEGAWTRATAEGAKVAAGYLTLRNNGSAADTLVSVSTPASERGEIHDMSMTDDGVMRMRHLADGIEIPAGGAIELKPGGMHLMFLGLKDRLVEGGSLPVTLTFKSGASATVTLPVKALGAASGSGHGTDKGNDHSHH
jgi:periplasmic copper chaperone A